MSLEKLKVKELEERVKVLEKQIDVLGKELADSSKDDRLNWREQIGYLTNKSNIRAIHKQIETLQSKTKAHEDVLHAITLELLFTYPKCLMASYVFHTQPREFTIHKKDGVYSLQFLEHDTYVRLFDEEELIKEET